MAIRDTSVKFFHSGQSGAPVMSGAAGALIGVLDACLINGYGSITADSLVVANGIATLTKSAGHGFLNPGSTASFDAGVVVAVSGVTGALSALNATWRATVTSTTVLTWECGLADNTATGTIACKLAPAGWQKRYSGTNKAVYARTDLTATLSVYRVDDSTTASSRIRGYETMSDVDTGTGPFPTEAQLAGGAYVYRSNLTTSEARPWRLFVTSRIAILLIDSSNNGLWYGGFLIGDPGPYKSNDAYCAMLIASTSASGSFNFYSLVSATGSWMARAYTDAPGAITSVRMSHVLTGSQIGVAGQAYPAPVDNAVHLRPVEVGDTVTSLRAALPGIWNPLHNTSVPDALIVADIPQMSDRAVFISKINSTCRVGFDIVGPWE